MKSLFRWGRGLGLGVALVACSSGKDGAVPTNVTDALAYRGTQSPPPALPAPVTFTPLETIGAANTDDDSYHRVTYAGSYPNFLASDWTAAPTTFGACIEERFATPGPGACTTVGAVCHVGSLTCRCSSDVTSTFGSWGCQ